MPRPDLYMAIYGKTSPPALILKELYSYTVMITAEVIGYERFVMIMRRRRENFGFQTPKR